MLECKDVPVEVWKEVRDKWRKVKTSEDIDWSPCALCDFVKSTYEDCTIREFKACDELQRCPLVKYHACDGWPDKSKLHIEYWEDNKDWDDNENEWYAYVKKFLRKLDELIEELES
jgi:hypothetical protein